jgi:hypothetical protein
MFARLGIHSRCTATEGQTMTRKHDTTNAPSIAALMRDTRAAYYQAHHDVRELARNNLNISSEMVGRAYIIASWTHGRNSVLVAPRLAHGATMAEVEARAISASRAEMARELNAAAAALRQPRSYPADKAFARRRIDRAKQIRLSLA